ncbi:MAG: hypothetical protein HYU78_02245 [Rhodocyclales bacterium]|nr:hypothetical protein [Rhodocyclales bacterium]
MLFYSESTGGFYDSAIHGGSIPPDAIEITANEHQQLIDAQSNGKRIAADESGRPILQDPPVPALAEVKSIALAAIDTTAGAARARYITVATGQEATYLMKGQQARDYAAAGYSGPVPLMVAAEQAAAGDASPQAAADRIIAEEAAWSAKAAQIEQERRSRKIAVAAAADAEAVAAIRAAAETALQAM